MRVFEIVDTKYPKQTAHCYAFIGASSSDSGTILDRFNAYNHFKMMAGELERLYAIFNSGECEMREECYHDPFAEEEDERDGYIFIEASIEDLMKEAGNYPEPSKEPDIPF